MIALDTNLVVRLLVQDQAEQARRVDRLLARGEDGEVFFLSDVVLAELAWVLHATYRIKKREIVRVFRELFEAEHLAFESSDRCWRAVRRYESGSGGLADYLIAERARDAGCELVATFDESLLAEDGFEAPPINPRR
jgi:predicted nucleic-acid-binding protein